MGVIKAASDSMALFGWLAPGQPAVLFSHTNSAPASQQYFSLTKNQHQPAATSQPNEAHVHGLSRASLLPLVPWQ
jgi:hypothetical protein